MDEGLAHVDKTGGRYYEAELHRLKGELLLMHGEGEADVEQHFQKAIDVASGQKARSLELRATVSLARLWQKTSARLMSSAGRRRCAVSRLGPGELRFQNQWTT